MIPAFSPVHEANLTANICTVANLGICPSSGIYAASSGTAPFEIRDAGDGNGIVGNACDDLITVSNGVDPVDGGAGVDRRIVNYRQAMAAVTGDSTSNFTEAGGLRSVTVTALTIEHFTVLTGSGADTITTGAGNDVIDVGGGANAVTVGNGYNGVTDGSGADTVTTGDGDDTINSLIRWNVQHGASGGRRSHKGNHAELWSLVVTRVGTTPALPEPPAPKPLQILLVEDNYIIALATRLMLTKSGFVGKYVDSGIKALKLLESDEHFDLLLTDFAMPEMTGIELAEKVRMLRPFLPIIMATGHTLMPDGSTIPFPILQKPFTEKELIKKMSNMGVYAHRSGVPQSEDSLSD